MIAFICAAVNIAILVRCFIKKESLFYPVSLVNLMWLAVHVLNILLGWNSNDPVYLILALPSLFFSVGFFLTDKTRLIPNAWKQLIQTIKSKSPKCKYFLNSIRRLVQKAIALLNKITAPLKKANSPYGRLRGMRPVASTVLLAFVVIVFLCYTYEFLSRLGQYENLNIWLRFRYITWDYNINGLFVYKYSSQVAFLLPSVFLISAQKSKKKAELYKFLISLAIAIVWSVLRTSRTSTFSVVIILVMTQILLMESKSTKRLDPQQLASIRKKKIAIFAAAVVFILAIFLYVALQKSPDSYGDVSVFEFFLKSLANYTNLSSAAFVEWYKQGFEHTYGTNSFRFLFAVLYKLGLIAAPPAANSGGLFITFEGLRTNALTVARAYVEDFGVVFMAFMMMVFGIVHGAVHRKAKRAKGLVQIRYALITAMLDIPLFFQIMTNQYLNVLSGWIQYVFWICLFTASFLWMTTPAKKQTNTLPPEQYGENNE